MLKKPAFCALPWQIKEIIQLKTGVYKAETAQGAVIFKKIKKPISKMEYIWGMMEHLPAHGFQALPVLIKANGKDIPLIWQGDIYFAYYFCEGQKANFTKKEELLTAFSCLAQFHKAARGFAKKGARSSYFDKKAQLKTMLADLTHWQQEISCNEGEFVQLYECLLPMQLQRGKRALQLLEQANYAALAAKAASAKTCIHGDVAARNFIMHAGKATLIDFDYGRYDLQAVDIARLLECSLSLWNYEAAVFYECMAAYEENLQLTYEEKLLLLALLHFPRRFWRLGKRFFLDGITQKSLHRLKRVSQFLPAEEKFLAAAAKNYIKG